MGWTLVTAAAPRSVDVSSAARSLVGKVDVIYTNTDNNVVSAYESLVKVGQDAKIPLVASDTDSVKRGAVAAYGINYRDLGEQTGRMVVRILKGESPATSSPKSRTKMELFVNPGAAEARREAVRRADQVRRDRGQVIHSVASTAARRCQRSGRCRGNMALPIFRRLPRLSLSLSLFSILGAIEIGLIFSLVALGVFISFRLLRFPT
jgi:hypothetical protein